MACRVVFRIMSIIPIQPVIEHVSKTVQKPGNTGKTNLNIQISTQKVFKAKI